MVLGPVGGIAADQQIGFGIASAAAVDTFFVRPPAGGSRPPRGAAAVITGTARAPARPPWGGCFTAPEARAAGRTPAYLAFTNLRMVGDAVRI